MPEKIKFLTLPAFCLALALLVAASDASAQDALAGEWRASLDSDKQDKIHLTFERRNKDGGRNQMGQSYDFSDLQGLSRSQAAAGGAVKFSMAREAGRIDCEGSFQNGKGSGAFRFTPNAGFVAAMKSRGFDFEQDSSKKKGNGPDLEERLFAATTLNVTTALADDLLSADFGKLDTEDLFKAAIFKVDSKFMREMKESGFPGMGMEELVKARIFKIDADYVRQVAQMGFTGEGFESLVKMRIFKVTPEFISEARGEGLTNLSVEQLVKMRIFNIDTDFIRRARAEGVPLDVEKLVQKRIGVYSR
ncbi:MAG TPA: hypothetical protein VIP46_03595 [Pyrinomonadaceae bacterium]